MLDADAAAAAADADANLAAPAAPAPTNSLSTAVGGSPAGPQRKRRLRRAGEVPAKAKGGGVDKGEVDAPASSIGNGKSFLDEEDELAAAYAEAGA